MEAPIDQYIDLVRDISSESLPPQQAVPLIVQEAQRLVAGPNRLLPEHLDPAQRVTAGSTHGRHLLYEDPTSDFVVVAMVWPKGADSLPHDHGTWGVVAVLSGELEVTDYEQPVPGGPLLPVGSLVAKPGDVASVIPPERDLHRMRNLSDDIAITIHTYGRVIEECHTFEEATGATTTVRPRFTTTPAELATTG